MVLGNYRIQVDFGFAYTAVTLFGLPFQAIRLPQPNPSSSPATPRSVLAHVRGLGSSAFARRLLTESL